jgi:hypothetical protein
MSPSNNVTQPYAKQTCPKCGEPNSATAKFCRRCGHLLTAPVAANQPIIGAPLPAIKKPRNIAAKNLISKAFYILIGVAWVLFSIVTGIWLYEGISSWGMAAFLIPALLFFHLLSPIAIWGGLVKKENYGIVTLVAWLMLSLHIAITIFTSFSSNGLFAALAATVLGWMVVTLIFAFVNNRLFGFPPIPRMI